MKKILSILAIVALIVSVSSCGNKKKKDSTRTHTHEDGTVYSNDAHDHSKDAAPAQESFEVKEDNEATQEHENADTENHKHSDEHGHEHGDDK
jgi:hypothetical protein